MGEIAAGDAAARRSGRTGGLVTRPLFALLIFSVLSIGMTYPLALHAGDALIGTDSNALNDSYLSIWIFGWQAHQLLRDPLQVFQGNIFYPFPNTLAFSEIILPEALMYLPVELATGNPVLAYNLVVLALFAMNGWTMYLWTFDLLHVGGVAEPSLPAARGAALLAGIIFAFCTYKLGEIRHVQLLAAQFMPLAMMYLARGLRRPTTRHAVLTALFFVLNAVSSLYYALFLAMAMVLYAAVDMGVRRYRLGRAHFIFAALAAGIAALLLLPWLLPFVQVEREFHFSASRDPRLFSARPASYLASVGSNWLYGRLTSGYFVASKGQPLFPGMIVLTLAIVGIWRRRRGVVLFLVLLTVVGFVLSFGPQLFSSRALQPVTLVRLPYYWLSLVITPLRSLNAPARFDVLVMLALASLAALGAEWIAERVPRRQSLIFGAFAALILLEYAAAPLPLAKVAAGSNISPVYAFLAAQPPNQPVVEIPMGQPTFADQDKHVEYTYNSVYHWQPLVNGYSTFIPPEYYTLVQDMEGFPSAETLTRLKNWGVVFVVVHSDRIKNAAKVRATLETLDGLEHVKDFGEKWLYRLE